MAHAPRFWIITGIYDNGEEYTPESNLFMSFDAAVNDVWSGQVDRVARLVFIDTVAQSSRDVTRDVMAACSDRSYKLQSEPHADLRDALEGYNLPFYDHASAEHEARAYAHQVQQDYTSHVRGW